MVSLYQQASCSVPFVGKIKLTHRNYLDNEGRRCRGSDIFHERKGRALCVFFPIKQHHFQDNSNIFLTINKMFDQNVLFTFDRLCFGCFSNVQDTWKLCVPFVVTTPLWLQCLFVVILILPVKSIRSFMHFLYMKNENLIIVYAQTSIVKQNFVRSRHQQVRRRKHEMTVWNRGLWGCAK